MPRKRRRNAGLGNRKPNKVKRPGKYTRKTNNNRQININLVVNSPCLNKNPDTIVVRGEKDPSNSNSICSDVIVNDVDVELGNSAYKATTYYHKVCTVTFLFEHKYCALDLENVKTCWKGRHGIIQSIKKDLALENWKNSNFIPIFMQVIEAARTGERFRVQDISRQKGRPYKIQISSPSAQIIADCL